MAGTIEIGANVEPWGKVAAIGFLQGERYYWFIGKDDVVSMIPASTAETYEKVRPCPK